MKIFNQMQVAEYQDDATTLQDIRPLARCYFVDSFTFGAKITAKITMIEWMGLPVKYLMGWWAYGNVYSAEGDMLAKMVSLSLSEKGVMRNWHNDNLCFNDLQDAIKYASFVEKTAIPRA